MNEDNDSPGPSNGSDQIQSSGVGGAAGVSTRTLTGVIEAGGVPTRPIGTEETAGNLALKLLAVFRLVVLVILIGWFATFIVVVAIYRCTPDTVSKLMIEGALPIVEKCGAFSTAVFGPLLAFVLGYYFGEKRKTPPGPG